MFRILHFADLHLDASFASSGLPTAVGTWRRVDLRATLDRIISLAREREVDAITIAGDLYEQIYTLPDTGELLKRQFAALAPIRVLIAPGEHDPYTSDSLYALTRWPENVTVFSQGWLSAIELAPEIYLWSGAYPPSRGQEKLDNFRLDREGVNLLLLHAADTATPSQTGRSNTYLIDAAAVQAAGFNFALLGGQHQGRLWPDDTPYCVYPGSPEPLKPGEADGAHQVVLLTIENGDCVLELIPINRWHYLSLEVDVTGCESLKMVVKQVEQAIQTVEQSIDERTICYVTLAGCPDFELDIEPLYGQVDTRAYIYYKTRLSLAYDLKQLAEEPTARGLLVRNFQARLENSRSDQERRVILNALNMALRALDGKKVQFNEIG